MNKDYYDCFTSLLLQELKPALGCTEPIAIAYAAAKAREVLGAFPEKVTVKCSGNIIKNVKGVYVPNSNGMKGIEAAAILGIVCGDSDKKLEVLNDVSSEDIATARKLLEGRICHVTLAEGVAGLFIEVKVENNADYALVRLVNHHTEIHLIEKNGEVVYSVPETSGEKDTKEAGFDYELLSISNIIDYASHCDLQPLDALLDREIFSNMRIAKEGMDKQFGVGVGRAVYEFNDCSDVKVQARALAAAGSDARMAGCALPVVINSGSGNQGLTVSVPVIVYARHLKKTEEEMKRALIVSNLVAIHQKKYIGTLSAYCGAVSAAAAAAAAIVYLYGGDEKAISDAIVNTLAVVGGIVCDGAKASCAGKISSSLEAAFTGVEMVLKHHSTFSSGEGLVKQDIEDTIETFGKVGRKGMKDTDIEILKLMLEED